MIQLMYISRKSPNLNSDDINEILSIARTRNEALDVTGLLASLPGFFYQVLEGSEEAVNDIMVSISKDQRHDGVKVLYKRYIQDKEFAQWGMAHYLIDESHKDSYTVLNYAATSNTVLDKQIDGILMILKGLQG